MLVAQILSGNTPEAEYHIALHFALSCVNEWLLYLPPSQTCFASVVLSEKMQFAQRDAVADTEYIPLATLLEIPIPNGTANYKQEVCAIVVSNCTPREKYEHWWKHAFRRICTEYVTLISASVRMGYA